MVLTHNFTNCIHIAKNKVYMTVKLQTTVNFTILNHFLKYIVYIALAGQLV